MNEILEGTIAKTGSILGAHLNPDESADESDMDEVVFKAACTEQNEVCCGKSPHTTFLNEALPTTVHMREYHPLAEVEDEPGFPFKVLMDHESELQESFFNFMKSNKGAKVEDQINIRI